MPKYYYEYSINDEKDFFIVSHAISRDRFDNLYELFLYYKENQDKVWTSDREKLALDDSDIEDFLQEENKEIKLTRLVQLPNLQFKGSGWFSAQQKTMRYQGKNKKLYERLRNERENRKSKNVSVADVNKELGLNLRTVDGVVPDKKWDELTKEQKKVATEYGIRPSKNYTK